MLSRLETSQYSYVELKAKKKEKVIRGGSYTIQDILFKNENS